MIVTFIFLSGIKKGVAALFAEARETGSKEPALTVNSFDSVLNPTRFLAFKLKV